MLSKAIASLKKHIGLRRLLTLSVAFLCLPIAAQAETRDARYIRLLGDVQAADEAKDWQGAAKKAKAAGVVLNSPQAYLLVLYYSGKLAEQSASGENRCEQIKGAASDFFNACRSCERNQSKTTLYRTACASCEKLQIYSTQNDRLAVRSRSLIERLESYASTFEAGSFQGEAYSEIARSGRACLARPFIQTQPPGASIELGGKTVGQTPARIDIFVGITEVVLSLDGHAPVILSQKALNSNEFGAPITLQPTALVGQSGVGQRAATAAAQGPTKARARTLEWTLLGMGSASLITSGVFLFDAISKRDDAEAINGESGQRNTFDSLKDKSRTSLTLAGVTGGIGAVALSVGLWLWIDDDGDKKTNAAQLFFSPDGMYLYGHF